MTCENRLYVPDDPKKRMHAPDDLKERIRLNRNGRSQGYGGCGCCGDTWDWKASHSTMLDNDSGCFPLCEECWQALVPATRLPFYYALAVEWLNDGLSHQEYTRTITLMTRAVNAGK